jgi:hypothetical protein
MVPANGLAQVRQAGFVDDPVRLRLVIARIMRVHGMDVNGGSRPFHVAWGGSILGQVPRPGGVGRDDNEGDKARACHCQEQYETYATGDAMAASSCSLAARHDRYAFG